MTSSLTLALIPEEVVPTTLEILLKFFQRLIIRPALMTFPQERNALIIRYMIQRPNNESPVIAADC